MTNRLFIALKIPAEIRKEIIRLRNDAFAGSKFYRWEPEDKIHLTLKFIGDVKQEITKDIISSLEFLSGYTGFNCTLGQFGFFFKQNQPKVLWMGLSMDKSISRVVGEINSELERFSIPQEKRKFQPHLTIKRLKGDEGKGFIEAFENYKVPEIKFFTGEIVLMKSDLLPNGSKYTELKKYNLKPLV